MATIARLLLTMLLATAGAASASDTVPQAANATDVDAMARELFHEVMSPYCPGSLLAECPSAQAAVMRDSIRAQLSRGREPAAIKAELVTIYGNSILASPPFEGLGGVAWLGTVAIFLGGLAAAGWWLRGRRTAPATESAPVPTDRDGALRQRLRSELAHDD